MDFGGTSKVVRNPRFLLGGTGMGSIVVCNSVRNRYVDWVGPDWTMCPVTGPCPAAVSSLAARGNALLVGVHRSSDDGIDRVAALRRGSSPEEGRDEDRQLTLEDCCGSILDRRIGPNPRRRRDLHRGTGHGLGVRVYERQGWCPDDFGWREFSACGMVVTVAADAAWSRTEGGYLNDAEAEARYALGQADENRGRGLRPGRAGFGSKTDPADFASVHRGARPERRAHCDRRQSR